MTVQLVPCKRCKCMPEVIEVNGLFYVQCHGTYEKKVPVKNEDGEFIRYSTTCTKCDKWHPYEFLGATRRSAVEAWNYANTHKTLETEE